MRVEQQFRYAQGIRFSIVGDEGEMAHAYLYLMHNDLHNQPFGLLDDLYVEVSHRGTGISTQLVNEVISTARKAGCYKLIATSWTSCLKVHELYERLGFEKYGVEFRMNFTST